MTCSIVSGKTAITISNGLNTFTFAIKSQQQTAND